MREKRTEHRLPFKLRLLLNRTTLWVQLAVLSVLMTTAITLILIYNNYTSVRNQAISNQVTLSSRLLQVESENLDQYLMSLANFCIQPYYDTEFTRIINQKAPLTPEQLSYVRQQMYYFYYTRSDLLEYELYLINQDISVGRTMQQQHMTVQDAPAFDVERAILACSESKMHHSIEPADAPAFFTYYHSLFQVKDQAQQSIVRLKMNTSYLKQLLVNHSDPGEVFLLLDENAELIYSNQPQLLGNSEQIVTALATRMHHKENYDTVKVEGQQYMLVEASSSSTSLHLLCLTPLSYIDLQFKGILRRILLSGLVVWLCTVTIMYMLLHLLTAPLKKLASQMQKTGHGDFQTSLHEEGSREIRELSDSFNSMVSEIDQLIQRTYIAELSEKDAKLTALEAQINPHFLYNTLQAISTEALINDQPQIHKMITSLASNLRYTIKDADLVPLKREMEYVNNYVFLQKMRMDESLTFTMEIQPETEDFLVPKISIHTLVENSIMHGMDKATGKITIQVSALQKADKMIICVRDNGCGISPQRLEALLESFNQPRSTGGQDSIGLANLYIRLQLLYEEPADMQIQSIENSYTEITLTLPAIKENPHVQGIDH